MYHEELPNMYHVTYWDTGEIYRSFENLARAKKYARGLGHTGEDNPILTSYPPIAYVANDDGEVVYNPYFGKNITAGSLVISNDDCLRG